MTKSGDTQVVTWSLPGYPIFPYPEWPRTQMVVPGTARDPGIMLLGETLKCGTHQQLDTARFCAHITLIWH